MNRLEQLRKMALEMEREHWSDEFYYLFYKSYERLAHLPEEERYGESFYAAFSELTPSISEGELIVGKRTQPMDPLEKREWEEVYRAKAEERSSKAGEGQGSHMSIDYELLLTQGIYGILGNIKNLEKECNPERLSFYKCCRRCLEAVVRHSEQYAQMAMDMSAKEMDPVRKKELERIARICRNVPANPAETFYEAVQSVHFVTHCISLNPFRPWFQQFQLGHPDRYLLPFYERDLRNGILTREEAQLLLDCLGIQINMRVPNGLSSGYMVGGRDKDGTVVANELTELCMQVIDDIRLVYPSVGFCYTEEMPESYLQKACELLAKGYSHPAVFGDDTVAKGLIRYGVPKEDAHDYIHSTCVEITPTAASNVWVASPYTNMPKLLLDSMDREYDTLEDLIHEVFCKLDQRIKENFEEQNRYRVTRAKYSMNPLLSCFVNDCLERGLDIEKGGARYNWTMPSFVGMGNLVDSLYAVKRLVYEEKRFTLCEFKELLDGNFEGKEQLRQQILNQIPKYGNDLDEIDQVYVEVVGHIVKECEKYEGLHTNGNLIPSVFCWVMHERFGRETMATPDGRKAGFPLGDGSGPCQGREMNGPTASVLSSTKWDHSPFIGGVAVNLKFSKASLGSNSLETMKAILKTYIKRGGFEVQINVLDNEILKKAQIRPEEYKDLVVRIGGYSDYFVRLSPEMQEEVILRTAHCV